MSEQEMRQMIARLEAQEKHTWLRDIPDDFKMSTVEPRD